MRLASRVERKWNHVFFLVSILLVSDRITLLLRKPRLGRARLLKLAELETIEPSSVLCVLEI